MFQMSHYFLLMLLTNLDILQIYCWSILIWATLYIYCVPKKHDHVFDDKLKYNCPFTKIFGTLIAMSIGHRQVFFIFPPHLFSAATLPWEIVKT